MPRNIVVCFDGTGNQISGDATNVMRLWSTLVHDGSQLGCYIPGVGTLGDSRILTPMRRRIRKHLDGAIGLSIRDNFIEAYSFIGRHYVDGDRIFLFGFSRGAFTARAVAGAIHLFGLAWPQHENLAPYVWRTYSNDDGDEDAKTLFKTAGRFKKRFARTAPIAFVGVWDTVSSFGLITRFRTLPHTRTNESVQVLRHALAIHERRACFSANHAAPCDGRQDIREVWFWGVHSDVGGGYPEEESALAKVPLEWMLKEAEHNGLLVDRRRVEDVLKEPMPSHAGKAHHSLVGWWRLLEVLPQRRWNHRRDRMSWHAPNLFRRRMIFRTHGEAIYVHDSVRRRNAEGRGQLPNWPGPVQWVEK